MTDKIKALLVEDNAGDAALVRAFLDETQAPEVELVVVFSLADALSSLEEDRFDIVLLDLSLPDSQGISTFSCMQEQNSVIPIVLLTGNDDEKMAIRAMKQGAQDYLVKGRFDGDLLMRSICYSIERQRLLVQIEKAREVEQHLAYHDVLTNLPNRLLFYDRVEQALVHSKRYKGLVAVLFLDLDGFKNINDRLGHSAGDSLLQEVASRLRRNMRESDTIARLGGDEFTILLKGVESADDVAKAAQKVVHLFSRPFHLGGVGITVTCSVGVSIFPFDGGDTESLVKKADFAMYRVKGANKNGYQLFNASMGSDAFVRISLENSLRHALENQELSVCFQPQASLDGCAITGMEALIRWNHPELGVIPPSEFIPVAEETGLIVALGEWILHSACLQNKVLQEGGYPMMPVAINLSARQFRELRLMETIAGILRETGLDAQYLMIEITETNAMQDLDYTVSTLDVLKEMGVRIALDDFGTGYSSLSRLKKLPIDLIKIDKAFVKDVPENAEDAAIITAIVALARSLGMRVIAEGVEREEQFRFLQEIECDFMQGFYLSKALPTPELIDLLDSTRPQTVRIVEEAAAVLF